MSPEGAKRGKVPGMTAHIEPGSIFRGNRLRFLEMYPGSPVVPLAGPDTYQLEVEAVDLAAGTFDYVSRVKWPTGWKEHSRQAGARIDDLQREVAVGGLQPS